MKPFSTMYQYKIFCLALFFHGATYARSTAFFSLPAGARVAVPSGPTARPASAHVVTSASRSTAPANRDTTTAPLGFTPLTSPFALGPITSPTVKTPSPLIPILLGVAPGALALTVMSLSGMSGSGHAPRDSSGDDAKAYADNPPLAPEQNNSAAASCPYAQTGPRATVNFNNDLQLNLLAQANIRDQAHCAIENAIRLQNQWIFKFKPENPGNYHKDGTYFRIQQAGNEKGRADNCFRNVKIASSLCGYMGNEQFHDWGISAKSSEPLLRCSGFDQVNTNPSNMSAQDLEGVVAVYPGWPGVGDGHIEMLYRNPAGQLLGVSDHVSTPLFQFGHPVKFYRKVRNTDLRRCGGVATYKPF